MGSAIGVVPVTLLSAAAGYCIARTFRASWVTVLPGLFLGYIGFWVIWVTLILDQN
jgi:putative Ca2+/H+ antiporter (TMEM165/GDT1 family)